jgi:hypothetical protein
MLGKCIFTGEKGKYRGMDFDYGKKVVHGNYTEFTGD